MPNLNPAVEAARQSLLRWIDGLIAVSPAEYQPGLMAVRQRIEADSTLPVDLAGNVLKAVGEAVLSGDFGPATHSDSTLA